MNLVAATAVNGISRSTTNNYFYDGTSRADMPWRLYAGDKSCQCLSKLLQETERRRQLGEVTLAAMTDQQFLYQYRCIPILKIRGRSHKRNTGLCNTGILYDSPMAGIMTFQIPEVLISQEQFCTLLW